MIGIFGALWGVIETTLGSVLHTAHVPFKGLILGAMGLLLLLVGRLLVPRRGATLAMGTVTAMLKLFSIGQFVLNPMIAIFMEALLAELALSARQRPSRRTYLAAGALAISWNFFHPFVTWGILAGQGILTLWRDTVESTGHLLGLSESAPLLIVGILVGLHITIGLLAGLLGWQIGQRVLAREEIMFQRRLST
jgi:ABC-type thiamin/hydroxymethylpyrimidine transport system permease subunit